MSILQDILEHEREREIYISHLEAELKRLRKENVQLLDDMFRCFVEAATCHTR